jgi:hypothetical protein
MMQLSHPNDHNFNTTVPGRTCAPPLCAPQVAACASQHIQALKGPGPDGRIISTFRSIENTEERLAELADMMGLLPQQQQQQQQQQLTEEAVRAKQLAAQLLAAAQGGVQGHVTAGSNGGSNGGSSSSSVVFDELGVAAAAAGAAASDPSAVDDRGRQQPRQ